MKDIDLNYLCSVIGNLSGIPVRIYENDRQVFSYSLVNLPVDPIIVYWDDIKEIDAHIGYFATEHFHYYGIVNSDSTRIVIGPTRQIPSSDRELHELAFRADVLPDDMEDFITGMKSIIPMPLESVMQMLCTVNYLLNGEKKTLEDIAIYDADVISDKLAELQTEAVLSAADNAAPAQDLHNTYHLEQTLMEMVRRGDTAALREWVANAPAVRSGVLAADQLRQRKNTFIVSATLAARAAIRGGMTVDDAFTLSDSYIQKCELLGAPDRITTLQFQMILDFTARVEKLRHGKHTSKLVLDVANYIQHHMSEAITAEAIAKELYMSRSYLSRKFSEETGETLTDFILRQKTEEARRLLRYSDKPLTSISAYLGFSSQSHFTRVFKKYTSLSPGEYRQRYEKQ